MVEDHRDHELLLVDQVPVEQPPERAERARAARPPPRSRHRRPRTAPAPRWPPGQVVDRRVERVVVGVQQVEAAGEPGVERLQQREVVMVLDRVVAVQVVEELPASRARRCA